MKHRHIVPCMALLLPAALHSDPVAIVNTGPGPAGFPGYSLSALQWVAVEFDVARPATITGIDGWMIVTREGFLELSLYGDGGEVPGALLFQSAGFLTTGNAARRGLSSLNWTVAPSSYWIGFEQHLLSAGLPFPSERPLRNGAVMDREAEFAWYEADDVAQTGVRIFAETDAAPVPEPASMLLFGTGVAGLLATRRRRRAL